MKNNDTYDKWIVEGYRYFSEVGPEGFSIKELSEKTGLARTSFHYYFVNKEDFFDQLIEYHMEEVRKFGKLATQNRSNVTESIARAMETLSAGILFHVQLFTHRHIPKFNRGYLKGHEINFSNGILDWFLHYFHLRTSKEDGKRAYLFFVDVLNSRLSNLLQTKGPSSALSSLFFEVISDFQLTLESYSPKNRI